MSNNKKLIDLFQSKGLLFPTTNKEVEEFEKFNFIEGETPPDWNAPEEILKRGIQKIQHFRNTNDSLNTEIEELRMVARKGANNLPQHIIDKMKSKLPKKNDK